MRPLPKLQPALWRLSAIISQYFISPLPFLLLDDVLTQRDLSAHKGLDNLIDACSLVQFKCLGSDGIAGTALRIAPEITF
jgi:hypothetical protein